MAAVGFRTALAAVSKDQPGVGDVHVSAAGGGDPLKAKRRKAQLYAAIASRNLSTTEKDMPGMAKYAKVETIDKKHGLVLGWAIVCKEDGVDYFDVQDDNIPEDSMLQAATDFAESARVHKEMHRGDESGQWLFLFPMTTDIAKAYGITTPRTGLMIGFKPSAAILAKFESGEYTGFSIGGSRIKDEEVN